MAKKYSKITCCRCGADFDYAEAEAMLESEYPSASYELEFYCGPNYYCGECACDIYGSTHDEDDMTPYGCISCGNPAYPDCMSSCDMFDD